MRFLRNREFVTHKLFTENPTPLQTAHTLARRPTRLNAKLGAITPGSSTAQTRCDRRSNHGANRRHMGRDGAASLAAEPAHAPPHLATYLVERVRRTAESLATELGHDDNPF
jgi:hypothetical protein